MLKDDSAMPQSIDSSVPHIRRQTSSQESVFKDREKEFYRRLQHCQSRYYSSVTLMEHSEEDALVIFRLLIPELVNLARFVEGKEDVENVNGKSINGFSNKEVITLCNSIMEIFGKAEITLLREKKDELISHLYSEVGELLNLLPKTFHDCNKSIRSQAKKYKKIVVFQTSFVLAVAGAFVAACCLYFSMDEPLRLVAPETKSFPLRLEYLENPIRIGYRLKTFSGDLPKVGIAFKFYDNSNKCTSIVTYILNGENDHWNHTNRIASGVSYITYIRKNYKIGEKHNVVFENILKDQNTGARKIHGEVLKPSDIASVRFSLGAWYNAAGAKGSVSADFYSWDKYVID